MLKIRTNHELILSSIKVHFIKSNWLSSSLMCDGTYTIFIKQELIPYESLILVLIHYPFDSHQEFNKGIHCYYCNESEFVY